MKRFNATLQAHEVIVAIDDKYSDNSGPYHIAVIWTGYEVRHVTYSSGYTNYAFNDAEVTATEEQKAAAAEWWQTHVNVREPSNSVGHRFAVKRSRKVKKGSIVEVREFLKGGWDDAYGHMVGDTVRVKVIESEHGQEDQHYTITVGCLDTWVRGAAPWWA
ncbi:hypothetical protein NVP2117O_50 [Vibrio phage 2.117.O._10N.261.45.E9]|nr:hypothetical protein NVP1117O_50 [Vibrio phage 1.117.O._10N.261.45.E9]AUR95451.1 hypothetical protein NVP1207B_44 [Vibrio phage 1.207.B._10N.222.51.C2]AUS02342.1 hypothetical protein NVP2117O_50 [Vibrio phage 2.117.O._10N.261.45.E9]